MSPMRTLILPLLVACSSSTDGTAPASTKQPTDTPLSTTDPTTTDTESTAFQPCSTFVPDGEGEVLRDDVRSTDAVGECGERLHALVMPAGSRFQVRFVDWQSDSPAHLELRDWNGALLGDATDLGTGSMVPVDAQWSGEHALVIRSTEGQAADYTVAITCLEGCGQQTTRYPIVFLHGMAGTDSFFDILDYWYEVEPELRAAGYPVLVEAVDPFQTTDVRAQAWMAHIDTLIASGVARRVNLIGHSQGGLDSRYVASQLDVDSRVRSVTTVSTPHRGAATADVIHNLVESSSITLALVDVLFDELAGFYGLSSDQDIVAQMYQLTGEASDRFNLDVPDRPDVAYFSWAGRTCDLLDLVCQAGNQGEIVTPLMATTHLITSLLEGDNDGLVSISSAKWGTYLGEMPADHLDEVGLLPGTTAFAFDHLEFYLDDAARLAEAGL